MATFRDLRKTVRERLDDPRLAVVFFETENSSIYHFANVLNLGVQGVLIESDKSFETGIKPKLMMKNPELNQWDTFFCRVAWAQITETEKQYKTGLEFLFPVDNGAEPETGINGEITPQDIDFLLNTRWLRTIPKEGLCSLLNCMSRRAFDRDTPFISAGDPQNCLYIIQKGSCRIALKNEAGIFEPAGRKREGDVIGDMGFLSAESLISDAVSESEMVVWELPASKFDEACRLQQGLIDFLTGLLTNRLDDLSDPGAKAIGRYHIAQPLGEGRNGFVYKGSHRLLNIPVAVKMMKHHQAQPKENLTGFKKKIRRVADLNHPHIAQIYDIEERYRTFFIIMEYIDGDPLDLFFERKILFPLDDALFLMAQICSALAHAHDQKLTHQHLTPSNIFITEGRHVLVSDFSLPAPIPEEGRMEDRNIYYMAPEQIKGGKTDPRSDIYSLGILIYEMLTGRTPFSRGEDQGPLALMTSNGRLNMPSAQAPEIPEPLKKFILKACAELPEKRYQSVHEIIEELSNESTLFKNALTWKKNREQEVSALLISHGKNQRQLLFKFLDEFSQKALDLGLGVNITGKIRTHENHTP
nr:protein kinase [Desulfobacula sp.]